ncbi:hypothetical protein F511_42334 [Dorcoceras hygrometricum]|uniref:Uncharacterized protein n=1 Tax=Dorcoceras hygrometricum TaxID=472368 RepID=A0A2Z7BGT6_9LAMI|nr:hypothetical protein F511_42334 [Dorcoceras hygrometricum]
MRATAPTGRATCVAIARPACYRARSCARGGAPPCMAAAPWHFEKIFLFQSIQSEIQETRYNSGNNCIDQIQTLALIPLLGNNGVGSGSRLPGKSCEAEAAAACTDGGDGGEALEEKGGGAFRARYGPFNPYIPIRSTTIGKSRVAKDPIAMHTSWRSNSDIASVTSIGYPRMSASGESSTTMHRLLHASGSHPIPTPHDPNFYLNRSYKNKGEATKSSLLSKKLHGVSYRVKDFDQIWVLEHLGYWVSLSGQVSTVESALE